MEIQPASIAQVRLRDTGGIFTVDEDVGHIAAQVREVDPSLSLHWSDGGGYFEVREACQDGKDRMVLTCTELDGRVIERLRQIRHSSYDFVREVDRMDAQADREREWASHNRIGEVGEKLAHALRKDLLHTGKAFIPRDVNGDRS